MAIGSLALVGGTADDISRYNNWMERRLSDISPSLVERHVWDDAMMTRIFGHPWLAAQFSRQALAAPVEVLTNEIKSYLVASILDDRKAVTNWFRRRLPVVEYLVTEGANFLESLEANCIADIEHPHLKEDFSDGRRGTRGHNPVMLGLFANWYNASFVRRRQKQTREFIADGKLVEGEYFAPEIQLFGDIHSFSIINRAQMAPLSERDIVFVNDLYSDEDTRFKDRQRRSDKILNFLNFPAWIRPLMRAFLLDKVTNGELAPSTAYSMLGRLRLFARFLGQEGICSPGEVNELAMERYLAWGNARDVHGKNWYTDVVQLMRSASILLPDEWSQIALDRRATRRIKYKQAPDDPRNRLYASREGANRAAPPEAIAAIMGHIDDMPAPIPAIFTIGLTTGARAEDLHAMLFDCLQPDPHDPRFMILTFWQNKVSRWNSKPLLKSDPAHRQMIEAVEAQRDAVMRRYGRKTKYLFPVFYGKRESFLGHDWTLSELKMLCIRRNIVDNEGRPFDFSWHPLRHHRGTQMAAEGHDILSIMFELGHASPDMASMYVNRRLDLKKNALIQKGGGKFYTIEGRVDEAVSELLVRKDAMVATRVCGGACTLPGQVGEWCEHAHACLTCRFFRADGQDVEHFRCERSQLYVAIEGLEKEAQDFEQNGQRRMADITRNRIRRNKDAVHNTDAIIRSIEGHGGYSGSIQRYKPAPAYREEKP